MVRFADNPPAARKLAIIGSGISGLTAAYYLHKVHDIHLFERDNRIGGHSNTIDLELPEGTIPVDTGFIVHNDRTYPNFIKLMEELDIKTQDTEMSFSMKDEASGLEYNGGNFNKLFAQRSNLFRPKFYKMLSEILRFNQTAKKYLQAGDSEIDLGTFLKEFKFNSMFVDKYLIPMGASIWSTVPTDMFKYPAHAFISFFAHHGLLDLQNRPQWRTIRGGSREYVSRMTEPFSDRLQLNRGVKMIERLDTSARLTFDDGSMEEFDGVIIATHSDQALRMLKEPSQDEESILSALPYQKNTAIVHTDQTLLPRRKRAWASWNYNLRENDASVASLTYNMNILQNLKTREIINVTLNQKEAIASNLIHAEFTYYHPLFTRKGLHAQKKKHIISGKNNTWYCGAYWHNGFHEDGVVSALDVVQQLGGKPL
jgi:predicted NAD/FAD-binding protein